MNPARSTIAWLTVLGLLSSPALGHAAQAPPDPAPSGSPASTQAPTSPGRIGDEVNVLDFGASPMAQNNSPAFQAAIDHAVATGIRRVRIPTGTFQLTGSLNLQGVHGLTVVGAGAGWINLPGTKLYAATADRPLFDMVGADHCTLRDFTIQGSGADGQVPAAGLLLSRIGPAPQASAGTHEFSHLNIQGHFTKAAVVSLSSEVNRWNFCEFSNFSRAPSAVAFVSDTGNEGIDIVSDWSQPADHQVGGNTMGYFLGCSFMTYGAGPKGDGAGSRALRGGFTDSAFVNCYFNSGTGFASVDFSSSDGINGGASGVSFTACRDESSSQHGIYLGPAARTLHAAAPGQTVFSSGFKFMPGESAAWGSKSDLAVYVDGVRKTEGADYTVTGALGKGRGGVGAVVFSKPPGGPVIIERLRKPSLSHSSFGPGHYTQFFGADGTLVDSCTFQGWWGWKAANTDPPGPWSFNLDAVRNSTFLVAGMSTIAVRTSALGNSFHWSGGPGVGGGPLVTLPPAAGGSALQQNEGNVSLNALAPRSGHYGPNPPIRLELFNGGPLSEVSTQKLEAARFQHRAQTLSISGGPTSFQIDESLGTYVQVKLGSPVRLRHGRFQDVFTVGQELIIAFHQTGAGYAVTFDPAAWAVPAHFTVDTTPGKVTICRFINDGVSGRYLLVSYLVV